MHVLSTFLDDAVVKELGEDIRQSELIAYETLGWVYLDRELEPHVWKLTAFGEALKGAIRPPKDDLNETTNLADRYPRKVRELEKHVHEWAHGMVDPQWPSKPPKSFSVCGTPFVLPI